MIFPLEELIKYEENMYEITYAASRRAYQLSALRKQEADDSSKVVSVAAQQVFTGEVEFRIRDEESSASASLISNFKR